MSNTSKRLGALAFGALLVAACGGGEASTESTPDATAAPATTVRQIVIGGDDSATTTTAPTTTAPAAPTAAPGTPATTPVTAPVTSPPTTVAAAPAGVLRYAEGGGAVSYNPAAVNNAQTAFLFPVYDTLTRQNADFTLAPGLATAWSRPQPDVWEFTVRDDVVFHDGTPFDAAVAAANIEYHRSFPGNPQPAVWADVTGAHVVDATTFQVEFSRPVPEFPLHMSAAPGMMINPNYLDGSDLTRNPQGSGPWIWSADESQAGVREVFTLNADYWNPADQGVERIEMTGYSDNSARLNALITGEADIATFTPDAQVKTGLDAGMQLVSVPNFFAYVLIADRGGEMFAPLADVRVRQAIAMAVDRDAYNDVVHAGRADAGGGIYPANFAQFHVPELDDVPSYDPDEARRLLAEAGYPDGFALTLPVMPAIQQPVELVAQMLGAIGIDVELQPLNNGELGGRLLAGEVAISWLRILQVHPATDLANVVRGTGNPFGLDDVDPVLAALEAAVVDDDPESARAEYGEATRLLLEDGIVIPLVHAGNNAMYSPTTSGVTMGLGMQTPLPLGVRVDG